MKYVDVIDTTNKSRHIGLTIDYYKERTPKVILFEDKQQLAVITEEVFQFELSSLNCGFVNKDDDFVRLVLKAANIKTTGKTIYEYAEYDFTSLVKLIDREYGIDKIKSGMIEVSDCITISSRLVFYIQHKKVGKVETYTLLTKDKHKYDMTKEYAIKAHKERNVPIFNRIRQGV